MSKYLGGAGHYLTKGLFYEFRFSNTAGTQEPYTLNDKDVTNKGKNYLSMYKIYMSCDSEYEAAQTLLESWPHWQKLCECTWFMKHLSRWREEREIRDAAIGKATLIKEAENGSVSAAKALLEESKRKGAGRPSKSEVKLEAKKQASIDNKVSSILERMADK